MATLELQDVGVDFRFFFSGERSFKRNLVGAVAGHPAIQHRTSIQALHDVSMSIAPGTRLALIGGNGAGKTTLLRIMGGVLAPSKGRAQIVGRAVNLLGTGIGIDPTLTTEQTIIGMGLLMGFNFTECRDRLARAVAFGELEDALDMPLGTLGQGHQVRMALGVAVAFGAEILLIDEMLEHLTPAFIDRLCHFIERDMPKDSIVVMAERSRSILQRVCTEAALLNQGRLADRGPLPAMLAQHTTLLTP